MLRDPAVRDGRRLTITTNNMGVIEILTKARTPANLSLEVCGGTYAPSRHRLIPALPVFGDGRDIDLLVQGTSVLHEGVLYVETAREAAVKETFREETDAAKALLPTLHEYSREAPPDCHPFGTVDSYDFIFVPLMKNPTENRQRALEWLGNGSTTFTACIRQWHYAVYRRGRDRRDIPSGSVIASAL